MEDKDFKNKDNLIQAAIRHFSRYSYSQASLNSIIKEAGVSKGSFYFHFKDKQSLYLHIFQMVAQKKLQYFNRHLKEEDFKGKDIFEILKIQSKTGFRFAAAYPQFYKLGIKFFMEKDSQIYHLVKDSFSGNYQDFFLPQIRQAIEDGQLRDDFDPDFITRLLIYLLSNFDAIFSVEDYFNDLDGLMELFDRYIDFIKYGLAKREEKDKND
ncbi:MAG: TetR/AcrR family transcriptional regulator [Actinomycetota bacterium]